MPTKVKLLTLLLLTVACSSTPTAAPPPDPCAFLTAEDIKAVVGEAPLSTHATSHTSGDTTVSQCFYLMPEQSKSITVEITTSPNVRKTWKEQFERGEEKESNETHSLEVKDLGTDAFWGGNRVSGALYVEVAGRRSRVAGVLKITIGGAGDLQTKMDRSKELARRAISRMQVS